MYLIQDKVLAEGVARYKKDGGWLKIADHVGGEVSWGQCQHRWSQYLSEAMQDNINTAAWTEDEVMQTTCVCAGVGFGV